MIGFRTAFAKMILGKASLLHAAVFCFLISGAFFDARTVDLQNDAVVLKLEDALISEKTSYLIVHLGIVNGSVVRSFGFGPWYSDMAYEVDHSGVTVSGNRITGDLVVSARKDNWPDPGDDRVIEGRYTIEAELGENAGFQGSYTGQFKNNSIEGRITGYPEENPFTNSRDTTYLDFWIDEPLYDSKGLGKTAAIRHPIRFSVHAMVTGGEIVGAQLTEGIFAANHPEDELAEDMVETTIGRCLVKKKPNIWSGSLQSLDFSMTDSTFEGCVVLTATPGSDHFATGEFQYSFSGEIIGQALAGTVQPRYNNTHDLVPTTIMGHIADFRGPLTVPEPSFSISPVVQGDENGALKEQAIQEAGIPVHPGVPGEQPFWNDYFLERFGEISCIYAPAFNVEAVDGATGYRFSVSADGSAVAQFQASEPWSSLAPIWTDIPAGPNHRDPYVLTIQALDGNGDPVDAVQTFHFRKKHAYDGSWTVIPENVPQRLIQNSRWMLYSPPISPFASDIASAATYPSSSKTGNSDAYVGWSVANAMHIAGSKGSDQEERKRALGMMDRAGEWLWSRGVGPRNFPQYHWDQMFTSVWAALTFIDLYQVSPSDKWRRRALNFAEAYRALQLENGTWTWAGAADLVSYPNNRSYFSGSEPWTEFDAGEFLYFLGKVRTVLETDEFADVERKALEWERENSAKTFFWRGHASKLSSNSGARPERPMSALFFAQYLIDFTDISSEDVELVEQIARYCEDQFVVWKGIGNNTLEMPHTIDENYGTQAASKLALVYFFLYTETDDPLHLAKAKALMNGVLASQNSNTGAIQFDYSGKDDVAMPDYHHKIAETTVNLFRLWEEMEKHGAVETAHKSASSSVFGISRPASIQIHTGSSKITVSSRNRDLTSVSVYSINGRLVRNVEIGSRRVAEISTAALPRGFYVIKATAGEAHRCGKILLPRADY